MSADFARLRGRALASVLRRLVLPVEKLLGEGAYAPFAAGFSRACDAAEAWFALGHEPERAPRLELEAVETRGSSLERSLWSTLWSASRALEFARTGELDNARSQFHFTLELVRKWPAEASDAAAELLRQADECVAQAAANVTGEGDPPLDGDRFVVPWFHDHDPVSWEAARRDPPGELAPGAVERSFDDEVGELVELLNAGRVALFCGAGVSIGSGIPGADALRRALLGELPASDREVQWLAACDLPFESFLESLIGQVGLGPLARLFEGERPGLAHRFAADLVEAGLLRTVGTTNFDELFETELGSRGLPVSRAWRPEELAAAGPDGDALRLLKLHGTVSSPESLGVTMQAVAGRPDETGRERAIAELFATDEHDAVLVLGYSCSDLFDVSPLIEALGDRLVRIFFVDHSGGPSRAEDVRAEERKNPFRAATAGTRLFCDTDALLGHLSRATTGHGRSAGSGASDGAAWRSSVTAWWKQVPERDRPLVGHSALGLLWYRCGDYRAAKAHHRVALAAATPRVVFQHLGGPFGSIPVLRPVVEPLAYAHALLQVGGCHRSLSEYEAAMRRYEEAARIARRERDEHLEAGVSDSLGTVHFNQGRYDEAVRCHERSLEIWRRLDEVGDQIGPCLANLGNAHGAAGRLDDALECFREAVAVARRLGDKMGEGSRLGGLGQVHRLRGERAEAEACYREALDVAQSIGDRRGIAHQLAGLTMLDGVHEEPGDAIADALRAAGLFEEIGDVQGQARSLGNLGVDFLDAGRFDAGVECLVRALEMAAVIGDPSILDNAIRALRIVVDSVGSAGDAGPESEQVLSLLSSFEAGRAPDVRDLEAALRRFFEPVDGHS